MAVVVKNKSGLRNRYYFCWLISIISIIAAILFSVGIIQFYNIKLIIGVAISIITLMISFNYSKKIFAGLKGERQANKLYKKLPDDYFIFNNIKLEVDGKRSEIDNIVVGNNGIFVIEAKNYKGRVELGPGERKITQYKIGKGGGKYNKQHYNPINQVGTHVYRVSEYLKENKLRTWVQGAVFFTNDDCIVNINSEKIPVFSKSQNGDKKLISYIKNYKNVNSKISDHEKCKIVEVLKGVTV